MSLPLFTVLMAVAGLVLGSFANVVIWRFPRGESLSRPASHCPACGAPVRPRDNIPVVSWLLLRGRCRDCAAPIPARYPLVEGVSALLFVLAALRFGASGRAIIAAVCFWLLLVLSAIDLDHYRLPNALVAVLAVIGVVAAGISQVTALELAPLVGTTVSGWLSSPIAAGIAGALLGGGMSLGIALLYGLLRGRSGLGMGDVKLLGALGFYIGPYVLLALFVGSVLGMVVGIAAARGERLSAVRIPFGPSLAAGAIVAALVGPAILSWYLGLAGLA
jgi:leader peptidase (prepilin peptidase)/N-methyltransferase